MLLTVIHAYIYKYIYVYKLQATKEPKPRRAIPPEFRQFGGSDPNDSRMPKESESHWQQTTLAYKKMLKRNKNIKRS